MAEVAVSALDGRCQKLVENARAALERENVEYAIEACGEVLEGAPGCVAVRRLQRIAQLRRYRQSSRWRAKVRGGAFGVWFAISIRAGGGDNVWRLVEKWIAADPASVAALTELGRMALERGMPETAVFAFEAVREVQPENADNLVSLGEAWLAVDRAADALRCADAVLAREPVHAAAQDLMRRAAVAETMTAGKWEEPTSFREKLK